MRYFLGLVLILTYASVQAQQFSHFNTGTLFDSFENPAQRAFISDSSRQFSFNFFIPNFGATGSFSGNGQASINSLIRNGIYNSAQLTNGFHNQNNLNIGTNSYWFMLKMYNRLDGDEEFGISAQTKAEGHGSVTDETLLLLDSYKNFDNGSLNNNLFNNFLEGQAYHQLSLTFRKKVDVNVAFGLKLSTLLGIYYNKLNIEHSSFAINNTRANLFLEGNYQSNYDGTYKKRDILGLQNPGAAISFGLQVQSENGLLLQGNVKDLGFIRWNKSAVTYTFSGTKNINSVIGGSAENDTRVLTATDSLTNINGSQHGFSTPINGKANIAISKKFNLATADFYVTPTFIVSKELFFNGLTAALVNHFTYKNLWFTGLAFYNQDRVWSAGAQLMYKTPNVEFYVGTEQLFQSVRAFKATTTNYNSSGVSAFIGFSAKFGRLIEHPANASTIPMGGEKGFFNRMWTRIFKRSYY